MDAACPPLKKQPAHADRPKEDWELMT